MKRFLDGYMLTIPYTAVGIVAVYWSAKLYNRLWIFAGYREMMRCLLASVISILLNYVVIQFFVVRMPLSYFVFGGVFQTFFLLCTRFARRFMHLTIARSFKSKKGTLEYAMLIGGGSAGQLILRDLTTTVHRNIIIKCIIDDDKSKWGCCIEDVPVIGGRESIPEAVKKYSIKKIYVAIPRATVEQRKSILESCRGTGCEVKLLPGLYQFTDGEVSLAKMRDVEVEDLLGHEKMHIVGDELAKFFDGLVVLVTGGGGSIGSELCRRIAEFNPKKLIVFDIYENNAFYLQHELNELYPGLDIEIVLGSVRDEYRVDSVFSKYSPDIVFHAAAHKHLSLVENAPGEAIKNNVLGTYYVALAALKNGCRRFIYISSDKAVNPTSILGATSRLCEMLMQTFEHICRNKLWKSLDLPCVSGQKMLEIANSSTEFTSIRFGYALDSEGAVFGLFKKQIASGGPVKVTHKKVTRFCMSLHDTVILVLQASLFAKNGEVFVLDMGEPYKIDDLVRNLIRLSGFEPDKDIRIEYTGLRPGEKLFEEPLAWEEGMRKTPNPRIYVANPMRIDVQAFMSNVELLFKAVNEKLDDVQERLAAVVNSYHVIESTNDVIESSSLMEQEPINNLEQIAQRFDILGNVKAVVPMNKGYINRTYRVETEDENGEINKYTLQRINTNVFKDSKALMDNFVLVTEHLKSNFRLPGRPDSLANQLVIKTKDKQNFYTNYTGSWRMLTYIDNVHSYDIPENKKVFYYSGVAFGSFLKAISTIDSDMVNEVIPNFHNTWSRYMDLEKAIEADPVGRVDRVQKEIDFLRAHKDMFKIITDALENKEIPLRLGHNDCNLNNVLFEDGTNMPVAVIDLDTVMPSTPLYDFGDSMRIGTNTAKDDEKDLTKVSCSLELYEQYARGWLEACGSMLTRRELELLSYASLVITSEDAIRFLTDYISGDTYYYISYLEQNLDRARTQISLLADMEAKLDQIRSILGRLCRELKLVNAQ